MYIVVSLKTKFKRHMPGEFHDCSWVFWSRHCSRKGARRVEERKKENDDESRLSPFLRYHSDIASPQHGPTRSQHQVW